MKNFKILSVLFLFGILSLSSCKKDDTSSSSSTNNSNNKTLHPPTWIQATWKDDQSNGYRFTSNDMFTLILGSELSVTESLKEGEYFTETIEDNMYEFIIHRNTNSTEPWHFNKLSDTQIEHVDNMNEHRTYTKQ